MDNYFQLTAVLSKVDTLRHTPAGIPILEVLLSHESWQEENGARYLAKFTLAAKIIGIQAQAWQHHQGKIVQVTGFLIQSGQRNDRPMLRIQNIQEYKG